MSDAPLTALAADIHTDPKMRAAWLEVAAARMAAQLMRTARQQRGLSQEALARALDVSQARISQIESGRVEDIPSLELLMRFIDACDNKLLLSMAGTPRVAAEATPTRTTSFSHREGPTSQPEHEAQAAVVDEIEAETVIPRRDYAED